MNRKLKPQAYIDEFYSDSGLTTKTVINWIKSRKINGEQTPTGRWLVIVPACSPAKNIDSLVNMLIG